MLEDETATPRPVGIGVRGIAVAPPAAGTLPFARLRLLLTTGESSSETFSNSLSILLRGDTCC